ncbi:MAG: sigma-70 family RNA polymerase sigma factor [Polyangiaceae bacterium]
MLDRIYREHGARLRARLIRLTRDFDLADDALQEAFAAATEEWPKTGSPDEPVGWIARAARNKAIDRIRRRELERRVLPDLIVPGESDAASPELAITQDAMLQGDDTLRLLFTCCHPALPLEGQVALTLRTVAGLTTEEIARAFLVSEATMAQRLVRTKAKIAGAGIAYRVPEPDELPSGSRGRSWPSCTWPHRGLRRHRGRRAPPRRSRAEAIRLARLVSSCSSPTAHECAGALGASPSRTRAAARVDGAGDLVLLEDQDRSRWDRGAIDEGLALLVMACRRARPRSPYIASRPRSPGSTRARPRPTRPTGAASRSSTIDCSPRRRRRSSP